MKLDKILVPLDGSEMAEAAISEALQMARSNPSLLILVRAANARIRPGADVIQPGRDRHAWAHRVRQALPRQCGEPGADHLALSGIDGQGEIAAPQLLGGDT